MENNENMQFQGVNTTNLTAKKPLYKKWWFWTIIAVVAIALVAGISGGGNDDQGDGTAEPNLGDYIIEIKSSRLAEDWEGKPVIIVKYRFTNNSDEDAAFFTTFEDNVFQNGVGLNECYFVSESDAYSSDNSTKELKPNASIDVEVAYYLNDTATPIDVEVSELFSFSDKKVTKTFNIE